jgi:hypothetical protein
LAQVEVEEKEKLVEGKIIEEGKHFLSVMKTTRTSGICQPGCKDQPADS